MREEVPNSYDLSEDRGISDSKGKGVLDVDFELERTWLIKKISASESQGTELTKGEVSTPESSPDCGCCFSSHPKVIESFYSSSSFSHSYSGEYDTMP